MAPGYGEPEGKNSPFYHYPDAIFSTTISHATRDWLHACWTDIDKVKEILASGIDIHTANANGFTGLHMAASKYKIDIAEFLLEQGADVNFEECNGLTPLDYCVSIGFQGTEKGSLKNRNISKEFMAMADLLESKGGVRKEELCWLQAANQEKYAPNA
jgi:ankyrin repeat protein